MPENLIYAILNVLVGGALLLAGRRLFWLFVGGVGFVAGLTMADRIWGLSGDWQALVIALVCALLGALLAVMLQKIAIGVGGFLAGCYIALQIMHIYPPGDTMLYWLICLVSGLVGAVLMVAIFDWALIFLSTLVGAALIVPVFELTPGMATLLFFLLVLVGFVTQGKLVERDQRRHRRK